MSSDVKTIDPWGPYYAQAGEEITQEAKRARRKFPPFNSSHEGYAVIAEELDELWDDVKANNIEHAIEEAIQVGAMALRFIADMRAKANRRDELKPLMTVKPKPAQDNP